MAESKIQPCLTFVETRSGEVISFMCARKGGYEDLTKEICECVSLTCVEKLKANESNGFGIQLSAISPVIPFAGFVVKIHQYLLGIVALLVGTRIV